MSGFYLGARSLEELDGVNNDLVAVVNGAIEITSIDFSVHDGLRTLTEQREYVRRGVSWTLDSRHITGHAVDLVPYINGKLRWEWEPIYLIAEAMRIEANKRDVSLRWGGAWDIVLTDTLDPAKDLVKQYVERRRALDKSARIDGPHFELLRSAYP